MAGVQSFTHSLKKKKGRKRGKKKTEEWEGGKEGIKRRNERKDRPTNQTHALDVLNLESPH